MKKQFVALLLGIALLIEIASPASAMMTTDEKSDQYHTAVLELENYLEAPDSKGENLYGILSVFKSLGRFEQSQNLAYYTLVHIKLREEAYDYEMLSSLELMELDQRFQNYLKDDMKGSPLCTVAELKDYVAGREKQHNGDFDGAMTSYKSCMGYYDAQDRYRSLKEMKDRSAYNQAVNKQNTGDFAGAYFLFAKIVPYEDSEKRKQVIEKMLGYKPASSTDNLKPVTGLKAKTRKETEITLKWDASAHAKIYEVQYTKSGSRRWSSAGTTKNTEYTVKGLTANTSYDFRIVAAIDKIKETGTVVTVKTIAKVTPSPRPTRTPSPKPTRTPSPKPTRTPTPKPTPAPLKITKTEYKNDTLNVSYSGGVAPLTLSCYHYFNENHNSGISRCFEKQAWYGKISNLVPGRTYWLVLKDSAGKSLWKKYTCPDEPFTLFTPRVSGFSLRKRKRGDNGIGIVANNAKATDIEKSLKASSSNTDSYEYIFYLCLSGKGIKATKNHLTADDLVRVGYALILPNGDEYVEKWGYWEFSKEESSWYICTGFPGNEIKQRYNCIPTGTYTYSVLMNDRLVSSRTFTIK